MHRLRWVRKCTALQMTSPFRGLFSCIHYAGRGWCVAKTKGFLGFELNKHVVHACRSCLEARKHNRHSSASDQYPSSTHEHFRHLPECSWHFCPMWQYFVWKSRDDLQSCPRGRSIGLPYTSFVIFPLLLQTVLFTSQSCQLNLCRHVKAFYVACNYQFAPCEGVKVSPLCLGAMDLGGLIFHPWPSGLSLRPVDRQLSNLSLEDVKKKKKEEKNRKCNALFSKLYVTVSLIRQFLSK